MATELLTVSTQLNADAHGHRSRAAAPDRLTTAASGVASVRRREFARLDVQRLAYLDYGGTALPPASLARSLHARLRTTVLGNPHSEHTASRASTAAIDNARAAVLRLLDADPANYVVCFTGNASAALRLVGESYAFGPRAPLVLSADNHNSVIGLREFAGAAGASTRYVRLDGELRLVGAADTLAAAREEGAGLFAFPAQSNFSGVQHSLELVTQAQSLGHDVLLDAAAYIPTNRLRLRDCAPEFIALSLHKIVGYPVQGALVARRDALTRLRRPWFAGGTVEYASVIDGTHLLRPSSAGFEDGTPDFLGLAAVAEGLAWVERVGIERIHDHVMGLTRELLVALQSLRHPSGGPMVHVYGSQSTDGRGACVAFNVLRADGTPIDYEIVERQAAAAGVAIRGGCFCNPGASEIAFGFGRPELAGCLRRAREEGFERLRFALCLGGCAVGALRASFGVANNSMDVERAVAVARDAATAR